MSGGVASCLVVVDEFRSFGVEYWLFRSFWLSPTLGWMWWLEC